MNRMIQIINHPNFMPIFTVASGLVATVTLLCYLRLARQYQQAIKKFDETALDLRLTTATTKQEIDGVNRLLSDQICRIAWLETTRNQRRSPREENLTSQLTPEVPMKPSITERRHRVLSLSRRGMDINTISNMLGTPHGEIELIIGLNRTM